MEWLDKYFTYQNDLAEQATPNWNMSLWKICMYVDRAWPSEVGKRHLQVSAS